MRRVIVLSLSLFVLLMSRHVGFAQERPPAILKFMLSEDVNYTIHEVEYENKLGIFTWETVNLAPTYHLVLEAYQVDGWTKITGNKPLPANTTNFEITLYHPLNFGPIIYRLSIQDQDGYVYDQRFVEINFAPNNAAPEITQFYIDTTETVNSLVFRAVVYWEVANRRPYTNLEFDQILPDGSIESIELPRTNLWVASFGHGIIQPKYVDGDIVVRLRMVDLLNGTVYAEHQLIIIPPEVPNPSISVGNSGTGNVINTPPTPTPAIANPNAPHLVYLDVNPTPVNRLEPFVVSWQVEHVTEVTATVQHYIYKGNSWTPLANKSIQGFGVGETSFSLADIHYSLGELRIHLNVIGEDGQSYEFVSDSFSLACFPLIGGDGNQCSSYEAFTTNASYQPFEHGVMIWRADINQVYVLGSHDTTGFFWQQFVVSDGAVETSPPDGLFKPDGAFAGVWANNSNVQGIGWATAPLQNYTLQVQYNIDVATPSSNAWHISTPQNIVVLTGSYTATSGPNWQFMQ